jgi:hypothetical protein
MSKNRVVATGVVVVTFILVLGFGGVAVSQVLDRWEQPPDSMRVAPGLEVDQGPGPTDDVAIVGDSITELSEQTVRDTLQPAYHLRVRGRGGYRIEEMEPYAVELAATGPEQVIINLGTNDILRNQPIDRAAVALERMVKDFSQAHCVHLVTVNETMQSATDPGMGARARQLNAQIRRIATTYHTQIIEWSAAVVFDMFGGSPGGPLTGDGVHPNAKGQKLLAALYQRSLQTCG